MFKKARENKKGFTLAELLIVVAIIAVLVAISIPIFTSRLEKSREAVDLANMRAAYAQVQAAGLTETTKADLTTQNTDKITYDVTGSGSTYKVVATVTYTQTDTKSWKTASPSFGGIVLSETPGATCTITFDAATQKTTISNAKSGN